MTGDDHAGDRRLSSSLGTRYSILAFLLFAALAAAFLAPVLFGDRALLPTDYLMRMSPWSQTRPAAGPGGAGQPELPWDPILWDAIAQFYPWRAFTAEWLRRGVIPFWDPHQFCGTPFLANSQSAPLYPLHLLLLGFATGLPVARAMALLAAVHLTLAGFLTFLWLRALRLSPYAASLGGIAFMFSSFAVTWLELPSFLTVACWLPLLFLTLHHALEAPTARRIAALAVSIALVLLGGHLQIAFYCLVGAGLYGLSKWGVQVSGPADSSDPSDPSDPSDGEPDTERPNASGVRPQDLLRGYPAAQPQRGSPAPVRLLLAAALGLMLAAPQLLPAIELSRHSHRAAATTTSGYTAYVRSAMPAYQLVRLFLPDFYGNPTRGRYDAGSPADYTEFGAFIGGVGLLLALAGLLAWRRRPRETIPAAVIAALSLLLALGTPLNALLYFGIPGFSQSGSPARVLVLFCFAGAWLAAFGAEALTETPPEPAARPAERTPGPPTAEPRSADLKVGAASDEHGCSLEEHDRRVVAAQGSVPSARTPAPPGSEAVPLPQARSLFGPGPLLTTRWLPLSALAVWLISLGGAFVAAARFVTSHGADFAPLLARSGPALQLALISAFLAVGVPPGLKQLARTGSVSASLAGTLTRGVLAALLLGELWFYGAGFNPTGPLAEVYPSTPLIAALRSGSAAGTGRVLPLNHRWSLMEHPRALLPPNSALALGLSDPQGYDSLFLGRYKGFTNLLVPGSDSAPPENGNMLFFWDPHSPLLPLLAADLIISGEALSPAKSSVDLPVGVVSGHGAAAVPGPNADRKVGATWALLYDQAGVRVYRCPAALPRAFVVTTWRPERDEAMVAQDLLGLARAGALGTTALIEGPTTLGGPLKGERPTPTGRLPQTRAEELAGVAHAPAGLHPLRKMGGRSIRLKRPIFTAVRTPGPHVGGLGKRTGGPHSGKASTLNASLQPEPPPGSGLMSEPGAPPASAVVTEINPNEMSISLGGAARPGMLVLLDDFYPGWHAHDETTGAALPIHRADLTFRGIEVGEGTRTIRLRYEPASFRFGLFLCLVAVASVAALSLVRRPAAMQEAV